MCHILLTHILTGLYETSCTWSFLIWCLGYTELRERVVHSAPWCSLPRTRLHILCCSPHELSWKLCSMCLQKQELDRSPTVLSTSDIRDAIFLIRGRSRTRFVGQTGAEESQKMSGARARSDAPVAESVAGHGKPGGGLLKRLKSRRGQVDSRPVTEEELRAQGGHITPEDVLGLRVAARGLSVSLPPVAERSAPWLTRTWCHRHTQKSHLTTWRSVAHKCRKCHVWFLYFHMVYCTVWPKHSSPSDIMYTIVNQSMQSFMWE